jgi:hypothetical protein
VHVPSAIVRFEQRAHFMQPFVQGNCASQSRIQGRACLSLGRACPMVGRDFTIVALSYHVTCIAASAVEIRCSRRVGSVGERRSPNQRAGVDLIGRGLISVGSFRA